MINNYKNIITKSYNYLLIFLAFIIPSGFYYKSGIVIALLLVLWILKKDWQKLKLSKFQDYLLPLFFIILVFSYLLRVKSGFNIKDIEKYFILLIIPVFFIGINENKKLFDRILYAFAVSSLLFITIALIYGFIDIYSTGEKSILITESIYHKVTSYGLVRIYDNSHPTFSSLFLNFTLYILYVKRANFSLILKLFLGALIITYILLLNSMIGLICMFFLFFIISFKHYKKPSFLILGLLVLVYIFNPLKLSKIEKFKNTAFTITDKKEERNVLTLRLVKWETALRVIKENPWFGVGDTNVKAAMLKKYQLYDYKYAAEHKYGPHNQYLLILTSLGIVGFLYFIFVLLIPLNYVINKEFYLVFLAILSIYFLTDDILVRQQGLLFFTFFYSLLFNQLKV